jgi:hypothetical protein
MRAIDNNNAVYVIGHDDIGIYIGVIKMLGYFCPKLLGNFPNCGKLHLRGNHLTEEMGAICASQQRFAIASTNSDKTLQCNVSTATSLLQPKTIK